MQVSRKKQPGISLRVVGWKAIARPLVRVLVDNKSVGILKDKQPQIFPVAPGSHTISVRRDFFRSQVLEFDLSVRQVVEFECGFQAVRRPWFLTLTGKAVSIAVSIASAVAVAALKLPYWSVFVLLGLALVAMAVDWWRCYIPSGAHLYLRRVGRTLSG
jgi:hypothetical protein